MRNIVVLGASGAIGSQFVLQLAKKKDTGVVYAVSRSKKKFNSDNVLEYQVDLQDENCIEKLANQSFANAEFDTIIIATGALHAQGIKPEKSVKEISVKNLSYIFNVNTIMPALIIKHFFYKLIKKGRCVCAALSAKVGSISDNRLGGWYSYRASKAALNMIVKCASIEMQRRNKESIVVGLHPGTVDSALSKPFQSNIQPNSIFTPEHSVSQMINVLDNLTSLDTGKCFSYDAKKIPS